MTNADYRERWRVDAMGCLWDIGFAFAKGVVEPLRAGFAQNATDAKARFDLNEQNR